MDRLNYAAATDFADAQIGTSHWPAFNSADAAVVCGAAALLEPAFPAAFHVRSTPNDCDSFDEQ